MERYPIETSRNSENCLALIEEVHAYVLDSLGDSAEPHSCQAPAKVQDDFAS
jgi:hypothetical protein